MGRTLGGGILIPPGSDEGRKNYLAVLQDRVAGDTDRLNRIIASYEQELRTYTYADILADYSAPEGADTLFGFMKEMIGRLRLRYNCLFPNFKADIADWT